MSKELTVRKDQIWERHKKGKALYAFRIVHVDYAGSLVVAQKIGIGKVRLFRINLNVLKDSPKKYRKAQEGGEWKGLMA